MLQDAHYRGAMDPSAYIDTDSWNRMLKECNLENFQLRENRYDQVESYSRRIGIKPDSQIVHMVTAADGAAHHYTLANNKTRSEGIQHAMELDKITRNVSLLPTLPHFQSNSCMIDVR